ncbi:hypothetical protein MKX01_034224 [Papaver californicum]|nr:hypothetical protein MKX01_034224 [Papaver californicum]
MQIFSLLLIHFLSKSFTSSITVIDNKTETHHTFDVSFYNDTIRTTVTPYESIVDQWIADVYDSFGSLDIEWVRLRETSQRNIVALLQLCLAHQCLVFQFLGRGKHQVPEYLVNFLDDKRIIFVGAGIDQEARKLWVDYRLNVARSEDLGSLADYKLGRKDLYTAELRYLMGAVLGQDLYKWRGALET